MLPRFYINGAIFLIGLLLSLTLFAKGPELDRVVFSDLPKEAQVTLQLIKKGGPFPYDKDGAVFGNYEALLPRQGRGYYHEYTVPTPGVHHRGARRIVTGAEARSSGEYYYTNDHYASFRRIKE